MARVEISVDDPGDRVTLRSMVRAAGHEAVTDNADVVVTDDFEDAVLRSSGCPTLVLATANEVPRAVAAMRRGVYGYIFVPFQPGETEIMIERVVGGQTGSTKKETPGLGPGPMTLEEAEERHIIDTLRRCKNNRTEAARVLGIGRNTLWRKLSKMRLDVNPLEE